MLWRKRDLAINAGEGVPLASRPEAHSAEVMKGALLHRCAMCAACGARIQIMAIYHLSVQSISRSQGRSATGAAAYRAGELIVEERTGEVHDYTRKRGVLHSEILAPKGAPDWALSRAELWNRVERGEKRKDAQVCRELNIALPHELSSVQRLNLINRYVKKNFVAAGMVADVCLHAPGKGEDNKNFHAHVLLTMRRLEGDGFGQKAREWNAVGMLESWRKNWATEANLALADAGHDARIDHRSHAARGLDAVPGQHQGPAVSGLISRGDYSEVAERQRAERATREHAQLAAQLAIAQAQATAADAELQQIEREAAERLRQRVASALTVASKAAERERVDEALEKAEAEAQAAAARLAQELAQAEQARQRQVLARAQLAQERAERQTKELAQAAQAEQERLAALELARQVLKNAEQQLELAVQAESQAGQTVETLKNAHDWAVLGQQQAGQSLLKTTQAAFKAPGWLRDISAYQKAIEALAQASKTVQAARQAVARAWQQVLGLDPAERAALEARQQALEARQAEWLAQGVPKPKQPAMPAMVATPAPHQVSYQAQDEDEDDRGPAPRM